MATEFIKLSQLEQAKVSLGCPILDKFLAGGLACGMVTEVTGEPGAGKTQLCLQVLQTVQWCAEQSGLGGSALYIFTEGEPPLKRLRAMAENRFNSHQKGLAKDCLNNIYVERGVTTPDELVQCLKASEQLLVRQMERPVRLIVIDSIANIFRDIGDNPGVTELHARTGLLFQVAALLKKYAACYSLAVLVVNQVMDVMEWEPGLPKVSGLLTSGRKVLPSMGLAWAHCVNVRLFLSKQTSESRQMQVVFAPHLQQGCCQFNINTAGIHGQAETEQTAPGVDHSKPGSLPKLSHCVSNTG